MRFIKDAKKIPVEYSKEFVNNDVNVLGGVVTYTPDIARFSECVRATVKQIDKMIVVDNGSQNFDEILNLLDTVCKEHGYDSPHIIESFSDDKTDAFLTVLKYPENKGIAQALADIMDFAIANELDWVLTLDDDSVPKKRLVENYKKFTAMPKLGTMTCVMQDRNYDRREPMPKKEFEYVYQVITSGCMMSVNAYKESDKYQPGLFIDRVDNDIVYNLTKNGYKHIKINYVGLLHEMGKGNEKKFLWHTSRADNYSQMRNYYIFRNEYIVRKKYPELIRIEWLQSGRPMVVNFLCACLKMLLYEDNKGSKIKAMLAGWRDGKRYFKAYHKKTKEKHK